MKKLSLYSMAALYILAGINHFWHPGIYLSIMPHGLPAPAALVAISGVAEIICGVLLIPSQTRRLAAWLTIALLVAVFPANIQMTLDYAHRHDSQTWLTILRLPLQAVLIAWAWRFSRR